MIRKYALLVGVDKYCHLPDDRQLAFVAEDISRLSKTLTEVCGFEIRETLTGKNANYPNLSKALLKFFKEPYESDTLLLFYFSGHGFLIAHTMAKTTKGTTKSTLSGLQLLA